MTNRIKMVFLILTISTPNIALADLLGLWVSGKADMIGGTGKIYENLETGFGYGGAAGLELLGIDFWGEALIMGQDQYMLTANIGLDASFGEEWVVDVGIDTGLILFSMEEPEQESLVIPDSLTEHCATPESVSNVNIPGANIPMAPEGFEGEDVPAIPADRQCTTTNGQEGVRVPLIPEDQEDELVATYDSIFASEANNIGKYALGWNAVRARIQVERKLVSILYIGLGAHIGYHYMTSGEDVQAGAKDVAIDNLLRQNQELISQGNQLDPPINVVDELKTAAGARTLDANDLNGINYNGGIYLKLDI